MSPFVQLNYLNITDVIESPVINMIDVLLPALITDDFDKVFNKETQPTLVYTCLGEHAFTNHQTYIWTSLEQARLATGPSLPIVLIISKVSQTEDIQQRLEQLNITLIIYEQLLSANNYNATLFFDFNRAFFVQGAMEPGGNIDFNRLTSERLFAVHAYMRVTGKSDVFHMENDNMLYDDLVNLMYRMRTCKVFLGIPRASAEQAVVSFFYIRNAYALEHYLRFITEAFHLGRAKAIEYMNTTWINEMSITARYLDRFADKSEDSKLSGIFQLPIQLTNRNCCLCNPDDKGESIIFDARTLGRYFGGNYGTPDSPFYWQKTELVDPRGYILMWKKEKGIRLPYIDGFRIVNLHAHSKRLERFSSKGNSQTTGKGFNYSLVHN